MENGKYIVHSGWNVIKTGIQNILIGWRTGWKVDRHCLGTL